MGANNTVTINVVANDKGAQAALARINGSLNTMGATANKQAGSLSKIENAFAQIGKATAIVAGGAAITGALKKVVGAASDAQQAVGGMQAVFGAQADEMIRASEAASNIGLSMAQYGQAATQLGSILKGSGVEDFANQTQNLITLASDLAATYGTTVTYALQGVSGAVRGLYARNDELGQAWGAVEVNALMAAEGITKAEAAIRLFEENAGDASGQFAREMDTIAGSTAVMQAELTNSMAKVGEAIAPAVTMLAKLGTTILKVFQSIPAPVLEFATKLALAAAAMKGLVFLVPKLVASVKALGMAMSASAFTYGPVSLASNMGRSADAMKKANAQAAKLKGALRSVAAAAPWILLATVVMSVVQHLENVKAKGEEIAGTFDEITGAATEASAKLVSLEFIENFSLEELEKTPFTLQEITQAAIEGGDAFADLQARARAWNDEQQGGMGFENMQQALENSIAAAGRDAEAAREQFEAKKAAAEASEEAAEATNAGADAAERAAAAAQAEAQALLDKANATDEARKAMQEYLDAQTQGARGGREFYEALDKTAEAAKGVTNAWKGGDWDRSREDVRKVESAVEDLVGAFPGLATQFRDQNKSAGEATAALNKQKRELIDLVAQVTGNRTAARNYINTLLDVPETVKTVYEVKDLDSRLAELQQINSAWEKVNGKVMTTYYRIKVEGKVPKNWDGSYSTSQGIAPVSAMDLQDMADAESIGVMAAMSPAMEAFKKGKSTAELTLKVRVDAREMVGLADSWEQVTQAAEKYEQTLDDLLEKNKDIAGLQRELANADKKDRKGIRNELARAAKQAAGLAKELGIADINAKKLEKAIKNGGKNASIALKLIAEAGKELKKAYKEAERAAEEAREVFDSVKALYDSVVSVFNDIFNPSDLIDAIDEANEAPEALVDAAKNAEKNYNDAVAHLDDLKIDPRQFSWNPNIVAAWQAEYDQAEAGVDEWEQTWKDAADQVSNYSGDAAGAVSNVLDGMLGEATAFAGSLDTLMGMGVSPEVINSLLGMGAEAGQQLADLLINNPELLAKYQATQDAIADIAKAAADKQAEYQMEAIIESIKETKKWQEDYFKKNPLKIKTQLKIKLTPKQKRALRALGINPKDLTGRSAQSVTININAPQVDPEATALEISQRLRQIENRTQAPVFT